MQPRRRNLLSFASFVFDVESGELTQNGLRVRVNKQTADLLTLLITHPGELVTRDQIRQALWPDQRILNHEKIVTNAIGRLRHIFRDDATNPKYIESIPKRGYRLVVTVQPYVLEEEPVSSFTTFAPPADSVPMPEPVSPPPPAEPPTTAPIAAPSPSFALWRWALAAILLLAAALPVVLHFQKERQIAAESPREVTLGIAPFETSGEGAKELAESFRLDLTDSLSQLPHVNVRAAHSLELFSLDESTFRDRANKLGLDNLLLGKITVHGSQCRIELELVRGKDLAHIASYQYDVSRAELASVRDKIQMETFNRLHLVSTHPLQTPQAPLQGGTSDAAAYDAYLQASYHLSLQTGDSMRLALKEYSEAIRLDPNFAKAYARLARTYFFLEQNSLVPEEEGFQKASEAGRKAIQLDPHSAEAHAVLGTTAFLHDWNLAEGEHELRQAISIDPNQPFYHQMLAILFCDQARFPSAFHEIDTAHAIDPFWVSAYVTEAHIAGVAGDNPRLDAANQKLMELTPDSPHSRDAIANADWNRGRYLQAIAGWRAMATLEHDTARIAMEDRGLEAFKKDGPAGYAKVRVATIEAGHASALHSNDFIAAEWYAQAGDTDKALAAIHQTILKRDSSIPGLAVLPAYKSLRQDPRFRQILTSLGLPLISNTPAKSS